MKKFGHFVYHFNDSTHYHHNVGDELQTLAVLRLLARDEHNTISINREGMHLLPHLDEPVNVVFNGWFLNSNCWPPASIINPIFLAFTLHVKKKKNF